MPSLIAQLLALFVPIVTNIIAKHQAANGGAMPTDAEITAEFTANLDTYLLEGATWRAAHPDA
jgi:hypothetical protein